MVKTLPIQAPANTMTQLSSMLSAFIRGVPRSTADSLECAAGGRSLRATGSKPQTGRPRNQLARQTGR